MMLPWNETKKISKALPPTTKEKKKTFYFKIIICVFCRKDNKNISTKNDLMIMPLIILDTWKFSSNCHLPWLVFQERLTPLRISLSQHHGL